MAVWQPGIRGERARRGARRISLQQAPSTTSSALQQQDAQEPATMTSGVPTSVAVAAAATAAAAGS